MQVVDEGSLTSCEYRPVGLDLDLKRQQLQVRWADGVVSSFALAMLRQYCPCAACKTERDQKALQQHEHGLSASRETHSLFDDSGGQDTRPSSSAEQGARPPDARPRTGAVALPILSNAQVRADAAQVTGGHLVGNYAIQLDWSDGHNTGIFDFRYLRRLHTGCGGH